MAEIQGTILAAKISPGDTLATFPTHEDIYGKGGLMSVTSLVDLTTAIPLDRQKLGMLIHVSEQSKYYTLSSLSYPVTSYTQRLANITDLNNAILNNYLPLSGGIITGNLNVNNNLSAVNVKFTGRVEEGSGTKALGTNSHAEGFNVIASGFASHAEGDTTIASGGRSHAEGEETVASGFASHAEGALTLAAGGLGGYTHAEGYGTALSAYSHAEGYETTTSGDASHAEGRSTTASGTNSHAEGQSTTGFRYQFSRRRTKYNSFRYQFPCGRKFYNSFWIL
jgi:trimeric autotransporter adhesin